MLIGAAHYLDLLCNGQIHLGRNLPTCQKTKLGWIISGPIDQQPNENAYCCVSTNIDAILNEQIAKFWEIDDFPNTNPRSIEEDACEKHFCETANRNADGRFVVVMPLKQVPSKLGNSFEQALRRFLALEKRLMANVTLRQMYLNFMHEYETLGHMSPVNETKDVFRYYLPHHGVLRENAVTTKLRVVFDGSAMTDIGISLNDIQMIGPSIQDDLISIILRFRKHAIVISADIEKMYRQVQIQPTQRPLQTILWRRDPSLPIQKYELNTVTYGTKSAPYLAIRSLFELAVINEKSNPVVSNVIKHYFHIDDLLTGADTIEEARTLGTEIAKILNDGCFHLYKWRSNNVHIVKDISGNNFSTQGLNFDNDVSKTLGLKWPPHDDMLQWDATPVQLRNQTKRSILSHVARIFDPLGLLAPSVVVAKIVILQIWKEKIDWDEPVPLHILNTWNKFENGVEVLANLRIPRRVFIDDFKEAELHGFSDASETAYGACIYVKSTNNRGETLCALLCAKGKVAPLKQLTIPRLELCGALLLAKLFDKIKTTMNITFDKCYLWCDSTQLGWLQTSPALLKQFVGHRVAKINELTQNAQWMHVPTDDNPADKISRGVTPANLKQSTIWWNGPHWMCNDSSHWPSLSVSQIKNCLPELRQRNTKACFATISDSFINFSRFSKYNRLIRAVSFIFRFINNCKSRISRQAASSGNLTVDELTRAEIFVIKLVQRESLPKNCSRKICDVKSLFTR